MCICCCNSRKSILIYIIIVSVIAFIYGIICVSQFAHNSEIYKSLIKKIKELESGSNSNNNYGESNDNSIYGGYRRTDYNNYPYNTYNPYSTSSVQNEIAQAIVDSGSLIKIDSLTKSDIAECDFIKKLKGIENGLGILLFVFTLIFLIIAIIFLANIRGIRETQILPTETFNTCYNIKMFVNVLAIIFILLGLLYGILVAVALSQYLNIMENADSCARRIVLQMAYGFYCFWYYCILSFGFRKERELFVNVGEENKIGAGAEYDLNGNVIVRAAPVNVIVAGVNPQTRVIAQPGVNPQIYGQNYQMYQQVNQVPNYNQQQTQGTMPNQTQAQTQPQNTNSELNLKNLK